MLTAASDGAGRGTTFTLQLPSLPTASVPVAAANGTNGASHERVRSLDIVLIEDNDDVVDSMVDWLQELGHNVRVARSGEDGLDLVQAAPPRVVLCDLGLPGIDGTDVCRSIRALRLRIQPVMIALTGWGRDGDLRRTREAGFDHHLVKPISPDKLNEMLRDVG